ncbi:MAG: RHS domain-containing protein, partial [Desulfuromonadales bacterium]|nr:RHS domain-containing protein [Desulfuromonadales bacterium]
YHNDHLGTPQRLTAANDGTVVWSAAYAAFGLAVVDPASTVENNLRFPGQYADAESGLYYNFHRIYDPNSGRYTQVDPIGFAGGGFEFVWVCKQ